MDSLEVKTKPAVSAFYFQRKVAFYSEKTDEFVDLFQLAFKNLFVLEIDLKENLEAGSK